MQAVIDACNSGDLDACPVIVIGNNSQSGALARAKREGIAYCHLSSKTHPTPDKLDNAFVGLLAEHAVDIIVLAGYMKKIGPKTLDRYSGRILNIHPALLPKYGGNGMYGIHVHEAVLTAGEAETGVTVHLVDAQYDTGPTVTQCRVTVKQDDTPESLAERVLEREHSFLVETLQRIVSGAIVLP